MSVLTKNAFRDMFEEYYNPLCNFAHRYLQDKQTAEDVVQDVFLKMWAKRESIDADNNIKSYVFQSTKNRCIELLRRNKIVKGYEEEKVRELENAQFFEEESKEILLKEQMIKSIRQLPPKCQNVFVMSKINGLTYSEIADELDISVKTVENQMGRALRLLRQMMKAKI